MPTPEQQEILDSIREAAVELEVLMPERADILENGPGVESPYGGSAGSETVAATGVPCRRRSLTGREAADAARIANDAVDAIVFPLGTAVTTRSRVRLNGRIYQVIAVPSGTFSAQVTTWCTDGGAA